MKTKRLRRSAGTGILLLSVWGAGLAAAENPWSVLAAQDIRAFREAVLDHHPGAVDALNPGFRQQLEDGYREALARAAKTTSVDGYRFALEGFANGFRDDHLWIMPTLASPNLKWPGFTLELRDGHYLVRAGAAETDLPAEASELLSCEGRTPEEMLLEDILPFDGNPALESSRVKQARTLLVDRGNPWRKPPPGSCVFREAGEERRRALSWRPIEEAALQKHWSSRTPRLEGRFEARPFGEKGLWVWLPSFMPSPEEEGKLQQLIGQAASWRNYDPLVFDLRGNAGGNSTFGSRLLGNLVGKEYLTGLLENQEKDEYVEWRVSAGNLEHLATASKDFERLYGADAPESRWLRMARAGMEEALRGHRPLWREAPGPESRLSDAQEEKRPANPVAGRVFLVTSGSCGSACLDFCDELLAVPGVTHVGLPTSADSLYMELRTLDLPSGIARMGIPIKVYRNRPRGNNQPYLPQRRFPGEIWDTAALQAWILGLTEGR